MKTTKRKTSKSPKVKPKYMTTAQIKELPEILRDDFAKTPLWTKADNDKLAASTLRKSKSAKKPISIKAKIRWADDKFLFFHNNSDRFHWDDNIGSWARMDQRVLVIPYPENDTALVEQLARAAYVFDSSPNDRRLGLPTWDETKDQTRETYRTLARAQLASLSIPVTTSSKPTLT